MQTHQCKIQQKFFNLSILGLHKSEFRKNDRNYQKEDLIQFNEIEMNGKFTGNHMIVKIINIVDVNMFIDEFMDAIVNKYVHIDYEMVHIHIVKEKDIWRI